MRTIRCRLFTISIVLLAARFAAGEESINKQAINKQAINKQAINKQAINKQATNKHCPVRFWQDDDVADSVGVT